MLEQTKRISFRISSVLSKVELEPGAGAGLSHWLRLRPKSTGSATLSRSRHFGPVPVLKLCLQIIFTFLKLLLYKVSVKFI